MVEPCASTEHSLSTAPATAPKTSQGSLQSKTCPGPWCWHRGRPAAWLAGVEPKPAQSCRAAGSRSCLYSCAQHSVRASPGNTMFRKVPANCRADPRVSGRGK